MAYPGGDASDRFIAALPSLAREASVPIPSRESSTNIATGLVYPLSDVAEVIHRVDIRTGAERDIGRIHLLGNGSAPPRDVPGQHHLPSILHETQDH